MHDNQTISLSKKGFYCIIIGILCVANIGYFTYVIGLTIENLSNSAIRHWLPLREWGCVEHSGEFSDLFALRNLGEALQFLGFLLLINCVITLVSVGYVYVRGR